MGHRREVFVAFLASGALWVSVLGLFLSNLVLAGIAAAYVALGAWLLARDETRRTRTVALLWVVAVLIWIALLAPVATLLGAIAAGLVIGSLLFGLWAGPALLVLQFIVEGRRPSQRAAQA
ncbi:hypothetical protein ACLM5J_01395 [Nocardioides sp. Bht2]|uniref:hypothetical protein n=1 Tax=Nocardioides sp. Bht2 TaxID=3392297 RepID=UPI0039B5C9DE